MNLDYVHVFLIANLLEIPIFVLAYWFLAAARGAHNHPLWPALFGESERVRLAKIAGLVTLANLVTHPLVFFGFLASGKSYLSALFLAEIFAIAGEAALHGWAGRVPMRLAIGASLAANLFSWQTGALFTYWLYY